MSFDACMHACIWYLHTVYFCMLVLVVLACFLFSVAGMATYDFRGFHTTSSCIPKLMIWRECLDPRSTKQLSWLLHSEYGRMHFVLMKYIWKASSPSKQNGSQLKIIRDSPSPRPPANFPRCRYLSPTVAKAWLLSRLAVCLESDWDRAHAWRTALFVFRLGEPCY